MKHIKTKIMKALALVLSMTFLLAFPPVSMYAEPLPATPTDAEYPPKTIIEQAPPSLDEEAADDTTDIPDAFPVEEPPVLEKLSAENADAAETDDVLDEPPAVEDDLQEPAANEPQEEPIPYPIRHEIAAHAYVSITVDGTFVSPKQPIATVVNHPNEVYLKKVDQDGKPLAGAVFGLYSAFDGCIQQATSDEDGVVKFTRIPYGEYVIKELKAPNGYLPSQTEIPLVIGADFKPDNQPIAAVVNHRKDIACIKVDTAGKPLAGVTFSLIHAVTHEVAETVVSDAQGKFHFTQFDYGKWLIREGEAPEGYSKMADIELTVDENWTAPEIIRCVNIPNKFWFFKSDNHKNALPGVTFALEDDRGNFLRELVSGEDGVVHVEDLAPGSYVIRELEPPDGYARTDETIEFTIDETYQVPAKLKRLVNYPSISTGVDFTATPLTWAGIALVGIAGLVIVLEKLRKSGKRSRR